MLRPRRLALAIALAVLVGGLPLTGQMASAFAATLNVCSGCTYTSIQAALMAAANRDVIRVGPGTYSGPVTITKSVTIIGSGAGSTIIRGGSPVVTIGTYLASSEPTVSISGVTITGGTNGLLFGANNAFGGGVVVVPAAGNMTGGIVSITESVITDNTVAPSASAPCGTDPQPTCTESGGAGIFNEGVLTLTNTTVSHNVASSDANLVTGLAWVRGGGIFNTAVGTLTLRHSTVTGNTASVSKTTDTPIEIGVGSVGGGIRSLGPLTVVDSTVSGNSAKWFSTAPVPMAAGGGGIDVAGAPLTMDGSTISGNSLLVTSTSTDPNVSLEPIGGGIHIGANASGTIRGSLSAATA